MKYRVIFNCTAMYRGVLYNPDVMYTVDQEIVDQLRSHLAVCQQVQEIKTVEENPATIIKKRRPRKKDKK